MPALPCHLRADLAVLLVLRPGALDECREELASAKGELWKDPESLIELAAEIRRLKESAAAAVLRAEPSG